MGSASGNKPQSSPILLLKDYLRDDMGSCSSSGFKSFPRRQCCLHRGYSSSKSCSGKSTLQRASEAVLNVIKSLQIPSPLRFLSSSSLPQTRRRKGKKGVLSRSFSRRLMSRNFWRRASSSSSSKGDSNNKPCTFVSTASSASANGDTVTATTTTAATNSFSVTNSTREWQKEEKEQFSPVSVLDCPLFDDDEDITSPFNSTPCSNLEEGAKHKHMQKSQGLNRDVASLNDDYLVCDNNVVEAKARELVNHVKRKIPSNWLMRIDDEADENILFDFFKQSITIGDIIIDNDDDDDNLMKKRNLCNEAEDWIRGQHQEQYLSWEGKELYIIKEMDKCWRWSKNNNSDDDEEIECVATELELEFFTSLVNEFLLDLTT